MTTKAKALDRLIDAIAGEDVPMTSQTVAGRLDTLADTLAGDDVTFSARDIAGRISQLAGMIEDGTISIGGAPTAHVPFYYFELPDPNLLNTLQSPEAMLAYVKENEIKPVYIPCVFEDKSKLYYSLIGAFSIDNIENNDIVTIGNILTPAEYNGRTGTISAKAATVDSRKIIVANASNTVSQQHDDVTIDQKLFIDGLKTMSVGVAYINFS